MMSGEPDYITQFRATVDRAAEELLAVPDAVAAARPAPGKWSPKEIIGHLIDSAAHNHQRFVRARWQDDLVFPGYAQDDWVAAQGYQSAPWPELVALWQSYNRHLARVMAGIPAEVRMREHGRHNLDRIAWRVVPADQPVTLEYFMRDYVGHLEHHLRQIAGVVAGGATSVENVVTSCWSCNYGKDQYTIEQLGLENPMARPPLRSQWAGLTEYLVMVKKAAASSPT